MTAILERPIDQNTEEAVVETAPTGQAITKVVSGKSVTMTPEVADELGRELDAIRERVIADLGEREATYIRRIIKAQRGLEVGGRALLFAGIFPLLAGPFAPWVFAGDMTANPMRNVWSYAIIFCGHFPDGTQEFTMEDTANESRGMWYFRQVLGSANLTGGKWFHILRGNLSFQIEHHLFPDIPAHRHAEISEEVQEICERYGIPYNKGPLPQQFATVVRKIAKLARRPF